MSVRLLCFYFNTNHTATYLSDVNGNPYQFFLNLPFGESMAEQRTGAFENRYKFNDYGGKSFEKAFGEHTARSAELDEETGLYYYGARYYNPKGSVWLSVDPLVEQTMDAYGYTYQNPINLVDPTGMSVDEPPAFHDYTEGAEWIDNTGRYIWLTSSDGSEMVWWNVFTKESTYGVVDLSGEYGNGKAIVPKHKRGLSDEAISFLKDPSPDAVEVYASYKTRSTGTNINFTGSILVTKSGETGASISSGGGISTDLVGGPTFGIAFHWSKRSNRILNVHDFKGFESNKEVSLPLYEFGIPGNVNAGIVEGKFNSGVSMGFSPGRFGMPSVSYEQQYSRTFNLFSF